MVYLFLANGFEEIEALLPLDILRRGGVDVTTVAVGGADAVTGPSWGGSTLEIGGETSDFIIDYVRAYQYK